MRNPRQEAAARLAWRREVRVLEPSPPAVSDGPWFADDPVDGGEVVPVDRPGAKSWASLCVELGDTALLPFCLERWLGPWRRLEPLPSAYGTTRAELHAVAEHVLAPIRHRACGRIGLRWTLGGFGTPFLPGGRQVRVERGELVDNDRRAALGSLGEAARFVGVAAGAPTEVFTPTTRLEADRPLAVDPVAAQAVGDWFGFCTSVLEQIRADAQPGDRPDRVQLWPEHFDLAVAVGDEPSGRRANLGGSAGDAEHPSPYLYVGPWTSRRGPFWNEPFGASLTYAELLAAPDQRAAALQFFRTGLALLDVATGS